MGGCKGKTGLCTYKIVALILIVTAICLLVWNTFSVERYGARSYTKTQVLPDHVDYEVMSQLPFSNVLYGPGAVYHNTQNKLKKEYPRRFWNVELPISRYPNEVNIYQTGLIEDPSIQKMILE